MMLTQHQAPRAAAVGRLRRSQRRRSLGRSDAPSAGDARGDSRDAPPWVGRAAAGPQRGRSGAAAAPRPGRTDAPSAC